jgi:hypothetical protein
MTEYCLAFPQPHPKQIPIKTFGKHEYSNLVYDPILKKLIFKGRVVEWRITKTKLKSNVNSNTSPKQYTYEALVIPDVLGKKRKIFKKKFEAFINDMNIQSQQPIKLKNENEFDIRLIDDIKSPEVKKEEEPKETKIELKPKEEPLPKESSPSITIKTQPNLPLTTQYKISILKSMIEAERDTHPLIYDYFLKRPDIIWTVENDDSSDEEEETYYY